MSEELITQLIELLKSIDKHLVYIMAVGILILFLKD